MNASPPSISCRPSSATAVRLPVSASNAVTWLGRPAATIERPSGENATAWRGPAVSSTASGRQVSVLQTRIDPSHPAVATRRPSGEKATS